MSWNLGFKFTLAGEKLRKLRVNTDAISTGAASDAKQGLSAHHLENLCWKKTHKDIRQIGGSIKPHFQECFIEEALMRRCIQDKRFCHF